MSDPTKPDDWRPAPPDRSQAGAFKWGYNAATGEAVVWTVRGPGDGYPSHFDRLNEAWGRPPSPSTGDVLGIAWQIESDESPQGLSGPEQVVVQAYYGAPVPDAVRHHFEQRFPHALVRAGPTA